MEKVAEKINEQEMAFEQKDSVLINLDDGRPLGGQVYLHLREMLRAGSLKPGSFIPTGQLAKELGISKTPLRDALIQLQAEGFLKILPQRGVAVVSLNSQQLLQIIQILGALESKAMMLSFDKLTERHLARMKEINDRLFELCSAGDAAYVEYNKLNIDFHNVFVVPCGNSLMIAQIRNLKERMYNFPDKDYGEFWRRANAKEHQELLTFIESGEKRNAADFMRDVHWSFERRKQRLK